MTNCQAIAARHIVGLVTAGKVKVEIIELSPENFSLLITDDTNRTTWIDTPTRQAIYYALLSLKLDTQNMV